MDTDMPPTPPAKKRQLKRLLLQTALHDDCLQLDYLQFQSRTVFFQLSPHYYLNNISYLYAIAIFHYLSFKS